MTIACDSVDFAFSAGTPVLRGVTCSARAGRTLVIVGPNGAGKSTLLRLMAGLIEPTEGRVVLVAPDGSGRSVASIEPPDRARHVAYVAQRSSLAFGFPARRVVGMGRHAVGADSDAVGEAMRMMDVEALADRPFHTLSAGQQQRVSIARAIAQLIGRGSDARCPRFLLADEPLAALDPRHALRTLDAFRGLAERGVGVVVVMHDLTASLRLGDDAIAIDERGCIRNQGDASEVLGPGTLEGVFGVVFESVGLGGGSPAIVPRRAVDVNRIRP